jgi:hypothetical protein
MPVTPTIFSPVLESIEIAYEALIKVYIADALNAVETYWIDRGRPLDLPDIPYDNYGDAIPDSIIGAVIRSWPYITLEALEARPSDAANERSVSYADLLIRCYTRGKNIRDAARYSKRYAQALMWVFRFNAPQPIDVGIYEVLALQVAVSETLVAGQEGFIKRSTIRVPLKLALRL